MGLFSLNFVWGWYNFACICHSVYTGGPLVENWFADNLGSCFFWVANFVVSFEKYIVVSDSPVFESLACNCYYSDNLAFDLVIYDNHMQYDLCHYNYNTQYLIVQTCGYLVVCCFPLAVVFALPTGCCWAVVSVGCWTLMFSILRYDVHLSCNMHTLF